jgi:hypothetical protein
MNSQALLTCLVSNVPKLYLSKPLQIFFAVLLLTLLTGAVEAQTFFADWTPRGNALTQLTLPNGTTGTITRFNSGYIAAGSGFMSTRTLPHAPAANYPQNYFVKPVLAGLNYTQLAAVESCTPDTGYNRCVAYTYAGTDQAFVVPNGVSQIFVKVWGAGGGGSVSAPLSIGAPGGSGAYVAGVLSTTPGSQYTVMVGQGGGSDGTNGPSSLCANGAYGFGGSCPPPRPTNYVDGGSGGGLSGLFTGSAAITATDQARAVFVSGGGGGGEGTTACTNGQNTGGAGGNSFAGTMPTMRGVNGVYNGTFPTATGGGGGFFGGSATTRLTRSTCPAFGSANGGSNFIIGAGVTDPVNLAGTETPALSTPQFTPNTPPRTTEQQYRTGVGVGTVQLNTPGGNGLVVIQWLLVPTAANVSISGRVLTADGRGIRSTAVVLTDSQGASRTVTTSTFGYYRFDEVPAGETYIMSVSSKRYQFEPRIVAVQDEIANFDFIAQE